VTGDGTLERQLAKLRKDLGEVFLAALADPDTVEICLNADGSLWQERLGEPLQPIGTMSASWGSPNSRVTRGHLGSGRARSRKRSLPSQSTELLITVKNWDSRD